MIRRGSRYRERCRFLPRSAKLIRIDASVDFEINGEDLFIRENGVG